MLRLSMWRFALFWMGLCPTNNRVLFLVVLCHAMLLPLSSMTLLVSKLILKRIGYSDIHKAV